MQFLNTFSSICFGVFIVMLVGDSFRPALFVALNAYSKPENRIRSLTLIRLAINLGFSAGPAIGGVIIVGLGYGGLFWVDGITCIIASMVLLNVLHPKKARELDSVKTENPISAYRDKVFLTFLVAMMLFGIVFLQYFSTITIYYNDVHHLSELQIGLLLGLNGFLIFIFEMPLVKFLESIKYTKMGLIFLGIVLTGLSFLVLNLTTWTGVLVIGMLFMTFGEMIAFPFSNAFAAERAKKGNHGEYMALYSISFSIAHIFGHNAGLQMSSHLGFDNTWFIITAIAAICALLLYLLNEHLKQTKKLGF
jgi:predicted MFS family arabinose efflux permease